MSFSRQRLANLLHDGTNVLRVRKEQKVDFGPAAVYQRIGEPLAGAAELDLHLNACFLGEGLDNRLAKFALKHTSERGSDHGLTLGKKRRDQAGHKRCTASADYCTACKLGRRCFAHVFLAHVLVSSIRIIGISIAAQVGNSDCSCNRA